MSLLSKSFLKKDEIDSKMKLPLKKESYTVFKKIQDVSDFTKEEVWTYIAPLFIDKYMWMTNGYTPRVRVKLFHTTKYIYLYYHVPEDRITIKYTQFGSDVYKDSCVEFFINPFPESTDEFFNIEFNALGVVLIGIGKPGRGNKRYFFKENEINKIEVISSIKKPLTGYHGKDFWELYSKIPKSIFENSYSKEFTDKACIGNFYKCGDETEFEHYGAWSEIINPTPNFHLAKYFGELLFINK
jgi:hypothetical protein